MKTGKWDPEATGGKPAAGAGAANRLQQPASAGRPRQAAITRNLYTWSNYKSWTEKVKDSWEVEKTKP